MSAVSINKFFRILKFLSDNPYEKIQSDLLSDSVILTDKIKLYQSVLTFDGNTSLIYPKDVNVINTSLQARQKIRNAYARTMIPGSFAFNTADMDLFRTLSVDWASTIRTQKDLMRQSTNAFSLDDEDIDKAIRGFGIDFVNQKSLPNIIQRTLFLYAMCDLYKIKGSPKSITKALQFVGVPNTHVREYWVERDPHWYRNLLIRGKPVARNEQYFDGGSKQYKFYNSQQRSDNFLSWENFQSRLWDIGEPHWWYTNDEIISIEFDPSVELKLPSITPYFGVDYYPDIEKYTVVISFLERILSDQFNSFLHGDRNLLPQEIGVDSGYDDDLSVRDVIVEGYDKPLTLLEAYLAFCYAQIRYDEYQDYTALKNYLISRGVDSALMEYSYPWSYQELIYWAYKKRNDLVYGPVTYDMILQSYPGRYNSYYSSQNELYRWWLERPLEFGESTHTLNNIPDIFFSDQYNFRYKREQQNTNLDRILCYNGPRNLDFKKLPLQYDEAINDYEIDKNRRLNRNEDDGKLRSYDAANKVNNGEVTCFNYFWDHLQEYYEYISWTSNEYTENIEHDGSTLTPYYCKKWPKPFSWNWAIDSLYYYVAYEPVKWSRIPVETSWDPSDGLYDCDGGPPTSETTNIGSRYYNDQYVYVYVSTNKWIRFIVETDWDFCDAPITPSGSIKENSLLSKKLVVGKISKSLALKYKNHSLFIEAERFDVVVNPYDTMNSTTRQMTYEDFSNYMDNNSYDLDLDGNIFQAINEFKDGPYLYFNVFDNTSTSYRWIRKPFEFNWSTNGSKIYQGEYHYPNLDLTNRYDAERILRGKYVLDVSEFSSLSQSDIQSIQDTNDGNILVSQGSAGYPEVWKYDSSSQLWMKNPINEVNNIRLGFNNDLIDWIDGKVQDESEYANIASQFITSVSTYLKVQFKDQDLDIAALFKMMGNNGLYKDIINFFKPKRARLLYFSIALEIDDRTSNSVYLDEKPEITKIIHDIKDYEPRDDLIFKKNFRGMTKEVLHSSEATKSMEIPTDAVYYLKGFDLFSVNGYYYSRPDLAPIQGTPCYINQHNMILTKVINQNLIYGYQSQWIIVQRKPSYNWCDCLYANYDIDILSNTWHNKNDDPSSSTPLSASIIKATLTDLSISDLRPSDITTNLSSIHDSLFDTELNWNTLYPRSEPELNSDGEYKGHFRKTVNIKTLSSSWWSRALCKDTLNIRRIFPNPDFIPAVASTPQNIQGGRTSLYDADSRNIENNEYQHSFWYRYPFGSVSRYPYYDSQLNIHGGPVNTLYHPRPDNEADNEYFASSNYKMPHISSEFIAGIGNGSTRTFYSRSFNVINPLTVVVYFVSNNIRTQISSSDYSMGSNSIYFNTNISPPDSGVFIYVSSTLPVWWRGTPELFYTGPDHQPVYIATQETIYDCYANDKWHDCCDYYDVGCRHDGLDNPYETIWKNFDSTSSSSNSSGYWTAGEKWEHHLNNIYYDANNKHHTILGFLSNNDDILKYEREETWAQVIPDIGNTFCITCDQPTFTPDTAIFSLPKIMIDSGVYHTKINAIGFDGDLVDLNGEWTSITSSTPVIINQSTEYSFVYGYKQTGSDVELRHIFHKSSGFYFWEIVDNNVIRARSKLKKKIHEFSDLNDEDPSDHRIEPNNFLNGHDLDVVEDRWCSASLDPSTFINSEISDINETFINGRFETSVWVSFSLEDYTIDQPSSSSSLSPYNTNYNSDAPGMVGSLKYDRSTNYLYVCTSRIVNSDNSSSCLWKRTLAEHEWSVLDEPNIRPDDALTHNIDESDNNNFFGYFYKNSYLYLYINTISHSGFDQVGWIRIAVNENNPSLLLPSDYTNIWRFENNSAFRYVNITNPESTSEESFVCGNPIPYNETQEGIQSLLFTPRCDTNIREKVYIEIDQYEIDLEGTYILIVDESGKEHRYIDSDINYYHDSLLPDASWSRVGSDNYKLTVIDNSDMSHNHVWFQ